MPAAQLTNQLEAVHAWHLQVGDDDVGPLDLDRGQSFQAVARIADGVVRLLLDECAGELPIDRRIIDDQHINDQFKRHSRALAAGKTDGSKCVCRLLTICRQTPSRRIFVKNQEPRPVTYLLVAPIESIVTGAGWQFN